MKTPESTTDAAVGCSVQRVVRCVAWIALAWGIIGGWEILGEWWPQFNRLTKDQVTIIMALAVILGQGK